jgi:hypothetical protein
MIVPETPLIPYAILCGMTEALLRRVHWLIGIVGLALFVFTGSYMRYIHVPPVEDLDDISRAVYRSRHIFLLLAAVANLARAVGLSSSGTRVGGFGIAASVILCIAPILLGVAFFTEPRLGVSGRSYSTPALYSLFAAALILAFQGRR